MSWIARVASLFSRWLHCQRAEEDLDAEVQAYFEIMVERHMARGLSRDEARRLSHFASDGPEQVKEKVREARVGATAETLFRDIRYACRVLQKSPGFTSIAVLTLALGIGANTAIFSLIDAVMLRLLPVGHPEQLVLLTDPSERGVSTETTERGVRERMSYPEFEQLRSGNGVFSGMLAAQNEVSELDIFPGGNLAAQPMKAHSQLVSGEFFQVLEVQPIVGRFFTPAEDKAPGANPVAVVSYDFWQRAFDSQPGVVGSTVRVGQAVFRILGVAAPGFRGILVGSDADLWFPITMQEQVLPGRHYLRPRDTLWLQVMGRLAPGFSLKTAESGINVAFQQALHASAAALPTENERRKMMDQKIALRPGARGASVVRGQFSDPLMLLMVMVGVVLLIACANIANLMLARASGRQREIGVRLALGAARGRLIRQLLTESLVVAALGGVLGLILAAAGTRLLVALVAGGYTNLRLEIPRDDRVLLFTALVSLGTGILFGLAPAIRATRLDVNRTLAANARGSIGGRGRIQTGRILAVAQVALSLVLLMGAALFVRSLYRLLTENLGYDRSHVLMIRIDPAAGGYKGENTKALYAKVRESLQTIPGVRGVSFSDSGLFSSDAGDQISLEGSPVKEPERLRARWTEVGPGYFKTLQIPLLEGREVDEGDAARSAPVCMINESFARAFFPGSIAIGKHVTDEYPTTRETYEIVGVVADSKEHAPTEPPRPRFYPNILHPIGTVQGVTFLVRSTADPAGLGSAVRQSIRYVDPNLGIVSLRTLNEQVDRRLITERLVAELASFFGLVALFMAAIGLYGVMSYSVSKRTSEIGIRMALGASQGNVVGMVLREAFAVVAVGIAIGLPTALALGRLISNRLYGLSASDPAAIATATLMILTTAVLAGYIPARRASRIDPLVSLRQE
jgi:predicted permease